MIGGGAFGTAMACVVRRAGNETALWAREPEVVESVNRDGVNAAFLPGVKLEPGIRASNDLAQALAGAEFVLLVVPAQYLRSVAQQMQPLLAAGTPVVSCAKGIERTSCALMPEVVAETLPAATVAVLAGPSFAKDIATDLPTGVTLACADPAVGERLAHAIGTPRFRTYLSVDVTGTALCGAMKNVFAIACGIAEGRKLGEGARATLIARGLAEMARLGLAKGARLQTFLGLCGVGDLTMTCNAAHSRNTSLGIAIGQGQKWHDILGERKVVTEGFCSVEAAATLAHRLKLDMPITLALEEILVHDADVDQVIGKLMAHPYDFEWEAPSSQTLRPKAG
ncbi:MAG TPA: NAD(P)H-dependent glycerol-3-phosphate dehydrogenase [Burkholderiales bacterium]|nr:NAD(P)H-dependent glycerol-3-phosphate dehydrogenase [Burkholderiales bacterium]